MPIWTEKRTGVRPTSSGQGGRGVAVEVPVRVGESVSEEDIVGDGVKDSEFVCVELKDRENDSENEAVVEPVNVLDIVSVAV